MNTIERAAKRLEELRRAGVDIAAVMAESAAPTQAEAPVAAPAQAAQTAQAAEASPSDLAKKTPASDPIVGNPDVITIRIPQLMQEGQQASEQARQQTVPEPATTNPADTAHEPAPERRSREVDLDLRRMSRANLLVPGEPRSQLEEEFRIIKRPLLENLRSQTGMRPERANLIMVTSAVPGEGKTQTAINLATSIAMELDHTVLLVEADVLRPSVLERVGVASQKGLLDLLSNPGTDLADVLLKTNIPKLTLLPAGTSSSRSTELLASAAMSELLEELASKYSDRVIVFDTPPLLSTTESRVLATHMGQVMMVVEAGRTPTSTVQQAFATLENHPVVLSMLNKYRGPKGSNSYGYYAP